VLMQQIFSPPAPPSNPIVKALEKNGMTIELELSKPNPASPASTNIVCRFSNSTQSPMSNLVFQVIIAVYIGVPCQV
jgi:hypothetical protein